MTVFYPDVSNVNWGSTELTTEGQQNLMNFLSQLRGQGLSGVAHKMSQGSGFVDPYGAICRDWCQGQMFPFIGYHYATTDDPDNQVANWHCARGGPNVMIDFEDVNDNEEATLDIDDFWNLVQAFNATNVNVALAYIPNWYWHDMGTPDLSDLTQGEIALVSSAYPLGDAIGSAQDVYRGCGADTGEGWAAYGNALPTVWQYTSSARISGIIVDSNAYHGTGIQLDQLFTGAS